MDAPHVRIVSMNAVDSAEGTVVMGEVVNEDTIPAFVNVNATLVDASGNPIDDESSFDKILHVLLPKQVSPYRIDFPNANLAKVKNVRMDVKATLVPASSDPVIGVMNQKLEHGRAGKPVLHGELLNQSGRDREYSARHRQFLRQQRQGDLGFRWLCGAGAASAIRVSRSR